MKNLDISGDSAEFYMTAEGKCVVPIFKEFCVQKQNAIVLERKDAPSGCYMNMTSYNWDTIWNDDKNNIPFGNDHSANCVAPPSGMTNNLYFNCVVGLRWGGAKSIL